MFSSRSKPSGQLLPVFVQSCEKRRVGKVISSVVSFRLWEDFPKKYFPNIVSRGLLNKSNRGKQEYHNFYNHREKQVKTIWLKSIGILNRHQFYLSQRYDFYEPLSKASYHTPHLLLSTRRFSSIPPSFTNEIQTKSIKSDFSSTSLGAYGLPGLVKSEDFVTLARAAVAECEKIRKGVKNSNYEHTKITKDYNKSNEFALEDEKNNSAKTAMATLHAMDAISNILCKVIDTAELCRQSHHDPQWRAMAEQIFGALSEYIHDLNTDVELYQVINGLLIADEEVRSNIQKNEEVIKVDEISGKGITKSNKKALLTEEARYTAKLLQGEFERSGVHLSAEKKSDIRQILSELTTVESAFCANLIKGQGHIEEDADYMRKHTPFYILDQLTIAQNGNKFQIPTDSNTLNILMRTVRDTSLRKSIYMKINQYPHENHKLLKKIITLRYTLAQKLGYPGYAHRFASERVLNNPDELIEKLHQVSAKVKPKAKEEINILKQFKAATENTNDDIYPWDIPYYMHMVRNRLQQYNRSNINKYSDSNNLLSYADILPMLADNETVAKLDGKVQIKSDPSEYLSLSNCITGLTILCKKLFNLDLHQVQMSPHEIWTSSENELIKVAIRHPDMGLLGHIYFDLLPRTGKYTHCAQFTIRCGCEVYNDEGKYSEYQLPSVALLCNFAYTYTRQKNNNIRHQASSYLSNIFDKMAGGNSKSMSSQESGTSSLHNASDKVGNLTSTCETKGFNNPMFEEILLSHGELETLFHEFGHAIHSLLSRCSFQHVAGTRCSVDLVEVPSHLFEYFVWDHRFLSLFAKHRITSEPIPLQLLEELKESRSLFAALDFQQQILYSTMDQMLFGSRPPVLGVETKGSMKSYEETMENLVAELYSKVDPLPSTEGIPWYIRFTHFVGYGAGYYSYLLDRAIAAQIWSKYLENDPLDPKAGELIWKQFLIHGGGKQPKRLLEEFLNEEVSLDYFVNEIETKKESGEI